MILSDLHPNPIVEFETWFQLAKQTPLPNPNSMSLATATKTGKPSVRIVLLKSYGEEGFVFYTNYDSRKGKEILENPQVALLFHWDFLQRQVRIEGRIEKVPREQSAAYFHSRPRESQLAATVSAQSQLVPDWQELENSLSDLRSRYDGQEIPLPDFWGGYRVVPDQMEFWIAGEYRLNHRFCYIRKGEQWERMVLAP